MASSISEGGCSDSMRSVPPSLQVSIKMIKTVDDTIDRQLEKGLTTKLFNGSQKKIIKEQFDRGKSSLTSDPKSAVKALIQSAVFTMGNIHEVKFYSKTIGSLNNDLIKLAEKFNSPSKSATTIINKLMARGISKSDFETNDPEKLELLLTKLNSADLQSVVNLLCPADTILQNREKIDHIIQKMLECGDINQSQKDLLFNGILNTAENTNSFNITECVTKILGMSLNNPVNPDQMFALFNRVPEYSISGGNISGANDRIRTGRTVNLSEGIPNVDIQRKFELKTKFSLERGVQIPDRMMRFDTSKKDESSGHTIDVNSYLENRLPLVTVDAIKQAPNVEYFLGTAKEMKEFYGSQEPPLRYACEIKSPSSTKFHLFEDPNNPKSYIVVISGIGSDTRLNHQTLQLKFSGVDVSKIAVRGNFKDLYEADFSALRDTMKQFEGKKIVCIMGQRWFPMEFLGKKVYPEHKSAVEGIAYEQLKPQSHNHGAISFDSASVNTDKGEVVFLAVRMPNGSLAHDVTSQLLEFGVESFIMIGAGGSLVSHSESGVGDYQMITQASYGDATVVLPQEAIITPDVRQTPLEGKFKLDGKNVTVDSPLEEHYDHKIRLDFSTTC